MQTDSLPRSFYFLAIVILMLHAATGTFQNYLSQATDQTTRLPSFLNWLALFVFLQIVASLLMLRYFHYRQYWVTFWVGMIAILASLSLDFILYRIISLRRLEQFYIPATVVFLGANTLLGLSIFFIKARERPFLKAAGAVTAILGGAFLLTLLWGLNTEDAYLKVTLHQVSRGAAWAGPLIPVLFSLNFWSEFRQSSQRILNPSRHASALQMAFNALLAGAALSGLFFSVRVGQQIAGEIQVELQPALVSEIEKARAQRFEAHTYVSSRGDTLPYRLMKPMNYDPQKKYPLVVCLHHRGAHGKDNVRQIEGSDAPFLAHYLNREKYLAFLFVPQCPQELDWQNPLIDAVVMETIQALESEFPIDSNKRYVMGASGGGYGSWHFIGTHPHAFAAAIPICGGGDPDLAPDMVKVAVWAFHGENDPLVPVSSSRKMIEAIRKAGGNPRYTEFAGAGHNIGKEFQTTPGGLDWHFAQQRK
ncbi:MAG: dienelactone hydrolase family protein [Cytophagales bacterium]|nr:dienelactone hydrolase family protein [Cytophagales bacterium]